MNLAEVLIAKTSSIHNTIQVKINPNKSNHTTWFFFILLSER